MYESSELELLRNAKDAEKTVMTSTNIPSDDEINAIVCYKYRLVDGNAERSINRAQYTINVINSLQFPLDVYRGLRVQPGKELRTVDNVGTHWTYNQHMFHSNHSLEWFSSDTGVNVILRGTVTVSDINWINTIYDIASDFGAEDEHKEYEIELKRDAIPSDIRIVSDKREYSNHESI